MKNFFIGILVGILLSGFAAYIIVPGMKQTAQDSGYALGAKEGLDKGIAEGIVKGIDQLRTEQKRVQDSTANARQKEATKAKAIAKPRKAAPVQNWRVEGGHIGEPIVD